MRPAIIVLAIVVIAACNNSGQVKNSDFGKVPVGAAAIKTAKIEFEQSSYDFGVITPGEKVTHIFKFKNTGDLPLVITNAQASCGCTVPEFSGEPLHPGEKGMVKVIFNSANKSGTQDAVVTITSNGEPRISLLHLTGDIKVSKKLNRR